MWGSWFFRIILSISPQKITFIIISGWVGAMTGKRITWFEFSYPFSIFLNLSFFISLFILFQNPPKSGPAGPVFCWWPLIMHKRLDSIKEMMLSSTILIESRLIWLWRDLNLSFFGVFEFSYPFILLSFFLSLGQGGTPPVPQWTFITGIMLKKNNNRVTLVFYFNF